MATGDVRRWVTAHYEVDADGNELKFEVRAHASHGFGERDAVVHVDLSAEEQTAVRATLDEVLVSVETDLSERAEEASMMHRIQHRDQAVDWKEPAKYVGPEVVEDDQVYSDPGVMELEPEERAEALRSSIPAHLREGK